MNQLPMGRKVFRAVYEFLVPMKSNEIKPKTVNELKAELN